MSVFDYKLYLALYPHLEKNENLSSLEQCQTHYQSIGKFKKYIFHYTQLHFQLYKKWNIDLPLYKMVYHIPKIKDERQVFRDYLVLYQNERPIINILTLSPSFIHSYDFDYYLLLKQNPELSKTYKTQLELFRYYLINGLIKTKKNIDIDISQTTYQNLDISQTTYQYKQYESHHFHFDPYLYMELYKDLKISCPIEAEKHYLRIGKHEKRFYNYKQIHVQTLLRYGFDYQLYSKIYHVGKKEDYRLVFRNYLIFFQQLHPIIHFSFIPDSLYQEQQFNPKDYLEKHPHLKHKSLKNNNELFRDFIVSQK